MSMEQFSSTLAPAIRELVLSKRENGAVYKHGEVLLGQFDQFCRDTEFEGTVLTEDLVMRWKQHNENRKHRQKSQMLTYVRHLPSTMCVSTPKVMPPLLNLQHP